MLETAALKTLLYSTTGRIARITLNRPERGNGITLDLPQELARCVEQANLDPAIHVIALAGNGRGFCGGYDLVESAEGAAGMRPSEFVPGSPLDPEVFARNHDPQQTWDPMVDYAMMSRNLRGFMSLFHSDKPVVCKVHGFCVAGGTDMALCSDLLVIADDAKIGYPPARVWGCRPRPCGRNGSGSSARSGCCSPVTASPARRPPPGASRSSPRPPISSTSASRSCSSASLACPSTSS